MENHILFGVSFEKFYKEIVTKLHQQYYLNL